MILDTDSGIPIWMRSPFEPTISEGMFKFWSIAASTPPDQWEEAAPALVSTARMICDMIHKAEKHILVAERAAAMEERGTEH